MYIQLQKFPQNIFEYLWVARLRTLLEAWEGSSLACFCNLPYAAAHGQPGFSHLGHALSVGEDRKIAAHTTSCRSVGVSFILLIVETLGGWSDQALETIRAKAVYRIRGWVSHQLSLSPTFFSILQFASGEGTLLCGRGDFLLVHPK